MVKEPLYLPGDKQELFDRYLDKTAHADLIERLRVITGALQNKLTPQKLRLHRIDRTDAKAHKENVSSSSDRFCRACLYEPD